MTGKKGMHNRPPDYISRRTLYNRLQDKTVSMGGLNEPIGTQGRAFAMWLLSQAPEGTTIAELLVSIAVDAYNDETKEEE